MTNPKRPDEILDNLSPGDKGLIDLPPTRVVDGVKYVLQDTEGNQKKNTLHIKPENLEKYVYVPTEEGDVEGEAAKKEAEQVEDLSDTDQNAEDLEDLVESVAEERGRDEEKTKEAILNNLEATTSLRSYFRNFLGINPEDFAKVVTKLRSRPNGDIIVANATQHYIGAKLGEKLAREGVQLRDTFELIERLNLTNPHTSLPEYYEVVREAYKELGYDSGVAKRLTDSFFEFISDAHVMGVVYAMRNRESDFGLSWARLYNQKLLKSGSDAKLYSASEMKQLQSAILGEGTVDADELSEQISQKLEEEYTETIARGLHEDYLDAAKSFVEDLTVAATTADITQADLNATRANLLRVGLDGKAVFSTPQVRQSLEYAIHKAYLANHNEDALQRMQDLSRQVIGKLEDDEGINYLKSIKEYNLGLIEDSEDGEIPGELLGNTVNLIFSKENGIFSEDIADADSVQRRLVTLGLLVYAKENGLALGAEWTDEQYNEAIDFIKENFSLASAIADYIAYQGEYNPTEFVESAARTMAAAKYTTGTEDIGSIYKKLSDVKTRNASETVEMSPDEVAEELTETVKEVIEEPSAGEEKSKEQDQKEGLPRPSIIPEAPLSTLYDGEPLILRDKNGEPAYTLKLEDDGSISVNAASGEEFIIPPEEAFSIISKFTDMEAADDPDEEVDIYFDVARDIAEAKLRYTAPKGAEQAAEEFGKAAAGEEVVSSEESEAEEELEEPLADEVEQRQKEQEEAEEAQEEQIQETLEDVAEEHEEIKETITEEGQEPVEEGTKEEAAPTEQQSFVDVAAEAIGKPLSDLDPLEFIRLAEGEEFPQKLGTSKPFQDILEDLVSEGIPYYDASKLATTSFISKLIEQNPNISKNQITPPKGRKNIQIPVVESTPEGPKIAIETRDISTGELKKTTPIDMSDEKGRKKVTKLINDLQRYSKPLKTLIENTTSNSEVAKLGSERTRAGEKRYIEKLAPKITEDLNNNFGIDEGELVADAKSGKSPLVSALFNKYNIPGIYKPTRLSSADGNYVASTPFGSVEGKTYDEAMEKLINTLSEKAKNGEFPEGFVDALKEAYQKDKELQQEYGDTVTEAEQEEIRNEFDKTFSAVYENIRKNISPEQIAKTDLSPSEYIAKEFKNRLAKKLEGFTENGLLPKKVGKQVVQDLYAAADFSSSAVLNQVANTLEKYIPGISKNIEDYLERAQEYEKENKDYWERVRETTKKQSEAESKASELSKKANDVYLSMAELPKKNYAAKTVLNKVTSSLEEVGKYLDELAKIKPESAEKAKQSMYDFLSSNLKGVKGIPQPDEIKSVADYAPYFFMLYNNRRKEESSSGFRGADKLLATFTKKPTRNKKEEQTTEKEGVKEQEESKEESAVEEAKEEAETEPTQTSIPSKSNIDSIFNTIKEKYVNGKKPPTEGRVKRAIKTQLSKALGGEPTPEALKKLNEYFGTDAESYDELLSTLAQSVIDAYDEKQSSALKESAKKVKETESTVESGKLPSGFDVEEVRRGLADFIENYPLPPKAVEDLVAKYGSDFSQWSPEALEELGEKLRTTLGNTSLGQSIQEFFPKGFIVEEQEPEQEENEEKSLDEVEGPSEEELEELEEEQ